MSEQWLIWSNEHFAWWRPNSLGYTTDISRAGRYDETEATAICDGANRYLRAGASPNEVMIAVYPGFETALANAVHWLAEVQRWQPQLSVETVIRATMTKGSAKTGLSELTKIG